MENINPQAAMQLIKHQLQPWFDAIANPPKAQEAVLHNLLKIYSQTQYGQENGADHISSIKDYRKAFPITNYEEYKPIINKVMEGDTNLLLNEAPTGWAITRGTTKGESKFIPMTPTDLDMRISAGRAMFNYMLDSKRVDLFSGVNLNLNFPSVVGTVKVGKKDVEYGYSSGIYTKHVSKFTPISSLPTQGDIDALGGGKTLRDWHNRFELAYQKCKDQNVVLVGGVCPTAIEFGRYLRKNHKTYPKHLWQVQIMTLGSTPGINTNHQPMLSAMYGSVVIREIYGATEGMFGQQKDEKRAWVPNYDMFFFEVETRSGIKMLHEMRSGEIGSLVVSTPVLPRYKIGDLILAYEEPYYRCIGREYWWTPLQYYWKEFTSFNLGQL
jgi:ABC-type cobalt transport system substrate-binding protein